MDDSVCMVWLAMNLLHFYRHESCGKCTPCREGGDWLYKLLMRVENGEGRMKDIDLLFGVANNIVGKTLCAFGDAAATPVLTTLKLFRHEFEAHIKEGRCTLPAPWRAEHPMVGLRHSGAIVTIQMIADALRKMSRPAKRGNQTLHPLAKRSMPPTFRPRRRSLVDCSRSSSPSSASRSSC